MTRAGPLIDLLADGQWHTGPELARELGISRAAISARVRRLGALGLSVYSVVGKGYRLMAPITLLNGDAIRASLNARADDWLTEIAIHRELDSTNSELARCDDGTTRACLAEYQSSGRGRAGRQWASPFGCNLYGSVLRRMVDVPGPLGVVALRVGIEIARMLSELGVADVGLKWPNDVWVGGDKLAGILIDHRGEAGGEARLIVGVGLNVAMSAQSGADIDQGWTRLADHLAELPDRNGLAARLLSAIAEALACFEQRGAQDVARDWRQFDLLADRPVELKGLAHTAHGIARGINADGSLRLETATGLQAAYSGDVSVRPAS